MKKTSYMEKKMSTNGISKKFIITVISCIVIAIALIAMVAGGIGKNDAQDWQIIQSVNGNIAVRDKAGFYLKWFATVWTYPRYVDKTWNDDPTEGDKAKESIRTTFNDGGTAQVSTYVRYATPLSEEKRIEFHRQFAGNIENATTSVKSHQINCIKATGPLMSASENQSARKAEFTQLVWDQMVDGLYAMKSVERETNIEVDPLELIQTSVDTNRVKTPKPTVIFKKTTELSLDSKGKPIVSKESPLVGYDIKIMQFSVTSIDYDTQTLEQFATKKQSYLAAEQSKADREKEKQERLNIIEKGLREVAQAQAAANVQKETAVVAAQLKAEVAEQAKTEALTKASMIKEVAEIEKAQAQIKLDTAALNAEAIIVLAKAEREKIELAGALTELEKAKIEAQVKMANDVSSNLARIPVPMITFGSNVGTGGTSGIDTNLINLKLMTDSGILDKLGINKSMVNRDINRDPNSKK